MVGEGGSAIGAFDELEEAPLTGKELEAKGRPVPSGTAYCDLVDKEGETFGAFDELEAPQTLKEQTGDEEPRGFERPSLAKSDS